MTTRKEAIAYCLTFPHVYEDYPFHDSNWTCMRIRGNQRIFAWIFQRQEHIWINVKCDPQWREFWRDAYEAVIPAYHMNKQHWNSIILDGTVPRKEIQRMIGESYDLCKGEKGKEA
ncbi:MAG: MmcQ/YjbR family DNA-binding protein [Lachnospiraceae bacterium]|nr:MmcQ/YjbR family DNA-binding protein [Lachnospiraceae bacterium]